MILLELFLMLLTGISSLVYKRNALTDAAHGASLMSSPVRWCTVNKPLATLTVHGWCQRPQSAHASVPASRMNGVFTQEHCREPGGPQLLRPQRSSENSRTVETMSCTHCRAALPLPSRQRRLGVGARWKNATRVKLDGRVEGGSDEPFQNKSHP